MKVAIIGGAGFIGCNAAYHFLRTGDEVHIFDNLSRRGAVDNLLWLKDRFPLFSFTQGDIRTDFRKLSRLVAEKDIILHLAAQVAVTTSVADPRQDFETNALGTFNVLEALREVNREALLIYSSTNKVYGKMEDLRVALRGSRYEYENLINGIDETRPLDFYSPYGCSKGAGDQYARDYARIYGLRTVVLRQSCIYGSRQFGVEDQGWVAWFVIAAVMDRPLTIYGDGKQVRDILHIDDLVGLFDQLARRTERPSGKIYNIGGGPSNSISLLDFIDYLQEIIGRKITFRFADWRPGDQPIYISDIRKVREEIGWEPKVDMKTGLGRLVEWVRENKELFEDYA